jgi:hypothetical protein
LLSTTIASANVTQAAGIGWETHGVLQACLDTQAKAWLDNRIELVVNDDPAAGEIDDAAVAAWAADALKGCAAKAGGSADAASEQQFMRYMAHWREHIYAGADEIKRRGRPD